MNDNQLDQMVERAFGRIVPDVLDSVLSDCREEKGTVIVINNSKKRFWRSVAGIAAALVLVIGGAAGAVGYKAAHTPTSVVSLDVNPSVEIEVNKNEKVLAVNPKNEDGKTIVGDMDFEGSSLDVTVNALIGSMLRNGYLSDISNSILVSVDSNNPADATAIQEKLSGDISALLDSGNFSGSVLSQVVASDKSLKEQADKHGISLGKAQLINSIVEKDPRYLFEQLAPLSINDLNLIRSSGGLELDNVNATGSASDKKYISEESAIKSAAAHAGVDPSLLNRVKAEFDLENGVMVYEVEFDSGSYEYEYDINAITGEILANVREAFTPSEGDNIHDDDYWEDRGEQYGEAWEEWAEQYGDDWEKWAEQYGNDWEKWGEQYGDDWEAWAEKYFDF